MKNYEERMQNICNKSKIMRKNKIRKTVIASSCSAVFVLSLLLVLFVPYSNQPASVAHYKGSPYYAVIEKLNQFIYEPPQYKNNYQMLIAELISGTRDKVTDFAPNGNVNSGVLVETEKPGDSAAGNNGSYVEVTDNQVAGVIEADIFKRSDQYIYHLMGNVLDVYTIAGENSQLAGRTNLTELMERSLPTSADSISVTDAYFSPVEMYLSQDCKTVIVVGDAWYLYKISNGKSRECNGVAIVTLDVTDPDSVKLLHKQLFTGNYVSSRMVNGDILLVYRHNNYRNNIDFEDQTTFIPQYGWFDDLNPIAAEDIVLPEEANNGTYTVVAKMSQNLQLHGIKALLSYNYNVYVSQDNIFLTHGYTRKEENAGGTKVSNTQMTEITGICYSGEELETLGTVQLEGSVKDQYSMDEYENVLRVVTTTRETVYYPITDKTSSMNTQGDSANLYCVDLAQWEILGSVLNFAPKGESVTSVRFDGSLGYVCTAELQQITDPVYFFDLSDPTNITYTDTGTIDGYSTSLIQFGNGNLLGVGINERGELKIEVFKEGEDKVDSVCAYERACDYSQEYKSYYVDRENQYIGLGIFDWEDGNMHYLLLHFNGEQLELVLDHCYQDNAWGMNNFRADIIDGYLYILWHELDVAKI